MYSFSYHAIAPFVSATLSVVVFLFLIVKNARSALHVTLGLFCLSAAVWQFATGMMFMSHSDELALIWDRLVYAAVNVQWLMHFHFTVRFLKAEDQKKWLVAAYLVAAFFAAFGFSDYLVHDLYRYAWGCHAIAGPLHHAFVLVSTAFYLKCLYMIFRAYRQSSSGSERQQYKYYMAGFAVFVSASLAYLPAYKVSIYPFSYWFASVYCLVLVYIIGRHRMLDIETVFHKTLLWLAVSAATLLPFATLVQLLRPFLSRLGSGWFMVCLAVLVVSAMALYETVQPRIDHYFARKQHDYRKVADRFFESVITLNDLGRLAEITRATLQNALYAREVRCFWLVEGKMREAAAGSERCAELLLGDEATRHLIARRDMLACDLIDADVSDPAAREQLAEAFRQTGAQVLFPVVHEETLHGLVTLDKKRNLNSYTSLDKRLLHDIARNMSVAVINAIMFQKEKEARRAQEELVRVKEGMNRELEQKVLERTEALSDALGGLHAANEALLSTRDALWGEMQLAKKIQTLLLPRQLELGGYKALAYMNPAAEVGGDYYDLIHTPAGDWLIIGDVSGHGVSAGLVMMMMQTAIHTALAQNPGQSPSQLLAAINELITSNMAMMDEHKHVTMTALACRKDGEFVFSGLHQDILIYRARTKRVEAVCSNGVWLGLVSPVTGLLQDETLRLDVGDMMLLFTDGVTEATRGDADASSSAGRAPMFGQERLCQLLAEAGPPEAVKDRIIGALREYTCDDDVTFLLVERTAASALRGAA